MKGFQSKFSARKSYNNCAKIFLRFEQKLHEISITFCIDVQQLFFPNYEENLGFCAFRYSCYFVISSYFVQFRAILFNFEKQFQVMNKSKIKPIRSPLYFGPISSHPHLLRQVTIEQIHLNKRNVYNLYTLIHR